MKPTSDPLIASFIGDALALGPHWVYDAGEIATQFGRVSCYHPPMTRYHPGKTAGDFTHYGDQMLVLLRSIAKHRHFDLNHYAADWRAYWEDPATVSYRDGATKTTLANLQAGADPTAAASDSHDLAGAGKIAPLFLLEWENDEDLIEDVQCLVAFTHGDPTVIDAAVFFAYVVVALEHGQSIGAALHEALARVSRPALAGMLESAITSSKSTMTDAEALKNHGLSCAVSDGFPGVCHLLLRHPDDPATALIENSSAGGDSAARGLILGMIYGAAIHLDSWAEEWREKLNARKEIEEQIAALSRAQISNGTNGIS